MASHNVNAYAEGGVVKKNKKNPLNPLAESMGEDTMVAVKENEIILNEDQIKALKDYAVSCGGGEKDGNLYLTPLDHIPLSTGQKIPLASLKDSPFAPQNLMQSNPAMLTKQPEIEKTNVDPMVG